MLAYFQNEAGAQSVQQLLSESSSGESALFISCVNLGEIAYITRRKSGQETAEVVVSAVDMLPIEVVGVDRELALSAADIKADYPISYADCFALALAKRVGGIVVTGDPEFEKVGDLVPVHWLPSKES
jgi:ribonuclease VapC